MTTASQIIDASKGKHFSVGATKKIQGHKSVTLTVFQSNCYDLWVFGSGSRRPIERINLKEPSANDRLALYL